MGRFDEFELTLKKISDFPLTYQTFIPDECDYFQDVRRYQSVSNHLDVRVIKVNGRIEVEPDLEPVPISKLTAAEKKDLVDYLKIRVGRGDNIGYAWAFFRSKEKKKPVVAYGANVVHSNAAIGHERIMRFLGQLQKTKFRNRFQRRWVYWMALAVIIAGLIFAGMKYGHLLKQFPFKKFSNQLGPTPEMNFYQSIFPVVFEWSQDDESPKHKIAMDLLKPEYVSGIMGAMDTDFHRVGDNKDRNRGKRLVLFVYFNYNNEVTTAIDRYKSQLQGTEFMRLARIYSCRQSGFASNIFYFKVGDLDIKHSDISKFMARNMITYRDFNKIRDSHTFSELMKKDGVSYKMRSFLEDVYTFTPLRIEKPIEAAEWYLLTRKDKSGTPDFAAFFHQDNATLVPKRISEMLLGSKVDEGITWYAVTDEQAKKLKLSANALTYFTKTSGQSLKLDVIKNKIEELGLQPLEKNLSVEIHRELFMGDRKGKYGIQTYDPLTSLVLSNLITKSSFQREHNVSLKRDPIQMNTTLVQLSKDDSFSVQSVTITPGTTGIIRMFEPNDRFEARLSNGKEVVFEKATVNLFNPYTFMLTNDSITFSFRNDITDMEIDLGEKKLKIIKTNDGNNQIIER